MAKEKKTTTPTPEQGNVQFAASQSSIEVSRNAKGQPQFSVKVYDFDPEKAAKKAVELYEKLEKALPFG